MTRTAISPRLATRIFVSIGCVCWCRARGARHPRAVDLAGQHGCRDRFDERRPRRGRPRRRACGHRARRRSPDRGPGPARAPLAGAARRVAPGLDPAAVPELGPAATSQRLTQAVALAAAAACEEVAGVRADAEVAERPARRRPQAGRRAGRVGRGRRAGDGRRRRHRPQRGLARGAARRAGRTADGARTTSAGATWIGASCSTPSWPTWAATDWTSARRGLPGPPGHARARRAGALGRRSELRGPGGRRHAPPASWSSRTAERPALTTCHHTS